MREWGNELGRPSAILSVSAHWLTDGEVLVGIQPRPRTIHDFGGFPDALHAMAYPAAGAPESAQEAVKALGAFAAKGDTAWGLDHGTWTVLHHMFPRADVPVFQLSIDYSKPASFHYAVGRAISALRDKGVLVMGSGNVVHNLRATQRGVPEGPSAATPWAAGFDEKVKLALDARDDKALQDYQRLDFGARMAVPTPDHYWPLLYALGAAGANEKPKTTYASFQAGTLSMRCVQFG
ncbi:4,5-DOPA dioxygenase extradiol [Ramlibacter sp. GTP1]|uniref:4,5-DOPA dioxygenase extradiol n=1 Tax=Ramlibacter albus TaxID=2079448 RepID=A0A923M9X4_9BURK|nr:4,5-DOPA dioxygenase extradiol [Ramlibacter albus]